MAKLTDGKRTVKIEIREWKDNQWTPDWSEELFQVGGLNKAADTDDVYMVDDVDYCIDYAEDWQNGRGDFYDDSIDDPDFDPSDRLVDVTDI